MTLEEIKIAFFRANETPQIFSPNKYSVELKKAIVDYTYTHNLSGRRMGILLTGNDSITSTINQWKRKYGTEPVAIVHGRNCRFDVRSKCLFVADYIEGRKTYKQIEKENNIRHHTLKTWVYKYKKTYKEYISTLPDGVPYVAEKKRIVRGNVNIQAKREELKKVKSALNAILSLNVTKSVKVECQKEFDNISEKEQKLELLVKLQKELAID